MVYISQGVLKRVRDDMFEHMQRLPIRYFDQNTNGSIMSLYTNDTITLRQMISQAIPGTDVVFHHHCYIYFHAGLKSPADTACHCCHRDSGICHKKNRWKQWKILCTPLVSCRRDRICGRTYEWPACGKSVQPWAIQKEEFDQLNEALFDSASQANKYAKHDGTGYRKYRKFTIRTLTAVLGGVLSVAGVGGITLGVMASYLQFTKEFYPAVYAGGTAVSTPSL